MINKLNKLTLEIFPLETFKFLSTINISIKEINYLVWLAWLAWLALQGSYLDQPQFPVLRECGALGSVNAGHRRVPLLWLLRNSPEEVTAFPSQDRGSLLNNR